MKILIAEDDKVSRLMMERILRAFGYEVVVAEDGRQAVEILSKPDGPRLALVDWMMPELDGVEVCREIRRCANSSYTYILLLTSKQSSEDIVAGLQAGADDYITKPCQPAELKARLHTGMRILSLEEKLVMAREQMRYRATHDSLTELWNRASILNLAAAEIERGTERQQAVSILLCDVDHFKSINDTHGHLIGDLVLKDIAARLASAVRAYDLVGRYGGEEFLLVLTDCDRANLRNRAEQIRSAIASTPVQIPGKALCVSISIGGLTCGQAYDDAPLARILGRADEALYTAKREGRNRVVFADQQAVSPAHALQLI